RQRHDVSVAMLQQAGAKRGRSGEFRSIRETARGINGFALIGQTPFTELIEVFQSIADLSDVMTSLTIRRLVSVVQNRSRSPIFFGQWEVGRRSGTTRSKKHIEEPFTPNRRRCSCRYGVGDQKTTLSQ